jgi:hypothetical protein
MKLLSLKKNKKRIINCYSRAEMERLHDSYIERGIMAEEIINVVPFSTITVYKLAVDEKIA